MKSLFLRPFVFKLLSLPLLCLLCLLISVKSFSQERLVPFSKRWRRVALWLLLPEFMFRFQSDFPLSLSLPKSLLFLIFEFLWPIHHLSGSWCFLFVFLLLFLRLSYYHFFLWVSGLVHFRLFEFLEKLMSGGDVFLDLRALFRWKSLLSGES